MYLVLLRDPSNFINTPLGTTESIDEARSFQQKIEQKVKSIKEAKQSYGYLGHLYLSEDNECFFYPIKPLEQVIADNEIK